MTEKRKAAEAARYLSIGKDSDSQYLIQERRVFFSLKERPKTMLMVAKETGIERASVCWFIRGFRKADKVQVHHVSLCPISKHRAGFYTTDSNLFRSIGQQLTLFDVWEKGGLL